MKSPGTLSFHSQTEGIKYLSQSFKFLIIRLFMYPVNCRDTKLLKVGCNSLVSSNHKILYNHMAQTPFSPDYRLRHPLYIKKHFRLRQIKIKTTPFYSLLSK